MRRRSLPLETAPRPATGARGCHLLPALLWLCASLGCTRAPASEASGAAEAPVRRVAAGSAQSVEWPRALRFTGELAPFEAAAIATKVPGRLAQRDVDLGADVAAGQVLARIEARDYELRRAQAEAASRAARARLGLEPDGDPFGASFDPRSTPLARAAQTQLEDAERDLARLQSLVPEGAATQADLDRASARQAAATSALDDALDEVENRRAQCAQRDAEAELARQALSDTLIRAPFEGRVARVVADRGAFLAAGAEVLELVRFDPVRLRLRVPATRASQLAVGQTLRLLEPRARAGSVDRLGPALDPVSRTLLVEADFPNPDNALAPGSFAVAEVVVDPHARATVVPLAALARFAGLERVFVIELGQARERRVEVGRIDDARVEVLSGLDPGAQVVLEPGDLSDGQRVDVAQAP